MICGFGRLGTWFGIERWPDVKPAMITFAKGVTSGYLPLGGVVVSEEVAAPYFEAPGGPMFRHGATYAGHPSVCAAALATIEIYEREDIIRRGQDLERPLYDALAPLAEHPACSEVRGGLGFLAAVAVHEPSAVATLAAGARHGRRARAAAAGRRRRLSAADLRAGAHRPSRAGDPRRA